MKVGYLNFKELNELDDKAIKIIDHLNRSLILKRENIRKRLIELDEMLVRNIGQYKMIQAGYNYGRMVELSKRDDTNLINKLPGADKLREFCREIRKSSLYNNYNFYKKGEYDCHDPEGHNDEDHIC